MNNATDYLHAMGIQTWRQSAALASNTAANYQECFIAYMLVDEAANPTAVLGLEGVRHSTAVYSLLDKMLSAIKLKRTYEITSSAVPTMQRLLLMGTGLAQQALQSQESLDSLREKNLYVLADKRQLLVTYHPADLLRDPANKAKAWQDLKKLLS